MSSNILMRTAGEYKPLSQLHNCPGPLLRLRLLVFFKGALLLGFKKSPSLSF
jgi:hypothetical protein